MDRQCNEAEGARLLETMRKICDATGCKEVEQATLAYEEGLREAAMDAATQSEQQVMR